MVSLLITLCLRSRRLPSPTPQRRNQPRPTRRKRKSSSSSKKLRPLHPPSPHLPSIFFVFVILRPQSLNLNLKNPKTTMMIVMTPFFHSAFPILPQKKRPPPPSFFVFFSIFSSSFHLSFLFIPHHHLLLFV